MSPPEAREPVSGETRWFPVFIRENGDEFVFYGDEFNAETEDDAWKIGLGASLVEGVLTQSKYTGRCVALTPKERRRHLDARLGFAQVMLLAGPTLDEHMPVAEFERLCAASR